MAGTVDWKDDKGYISDGSSKLSDVSCNLTVARKKGILSIDESSIRLLDSDAFLDQGMYTLNVEHDGQEYQGSIILLRPCDGQRPTCKIIGSSDLRAVP
jgi:hypothetical protein